MRQWRLILLLAAEALLATSATQIVEYTNYCDPKTGACATYVAATIHGELDTAEQLRVDFNTPRGSSRVRASAPVVPLYFPRSLYMINNGAETSDGAFVAFKDFEQDVTAGIHYGSGVIGTGNPPRSISARPLTTSACALPVEQCQFLTRDNISFKVTASASVDAVLATDAMNRGLTLSFDDGAIVANYGKYNSYVQGNERILSLKKHGLSVWSNQTHVTLYAPQKAADHMGDAVAMLTMIAAIVVVIEVSTRTTQSMYGVKLCAANFTRTTTFVLFDVSASTVALVAFRVYNNRPVFEEIMFAIGDKERRALDIVSLMVCSTSTAVAGYNWYTYGQKTILHHSLWVWTRCAYEICVVVAACSTAPLIAGTKFVHLFKFVCGIVLAAIVGRDLSYVLRTTTSKLRLVPVAHAAATMTVVTFDLLRAVFQTSMSFPTTDEFMSFLSVATALIIALLAASVSTPANAQKSEKAQQFLQKIEL